ncbi:3-hydroxyisobutyryl-CoA hydrolase [Gluconacetobacter sp. SXCC-1]|uniref:3-hydroxyisobutyryl-CoA hydrolase n=1 Tax=Komagataeibacter rhaeticus TaxID=215221 RepID=A0A181C6B4_9PROT|nr:enoyl-CoA hydratase/isomerase family protein [Komagataeibacter rhaeticus]ATU73986.1 enoyl-CoA hydratase/isomerase family protein [Komagataeibacter xylinus]EGG77835.1 3-hydroxyisobutyryl-CoA hydrolase [Gluconacetobacter sp. SXCC-1]QIP34126.1 enoyl-CoA hydratase/isomerase family protein [Komagataeibacter rhaeticus]QOC46637.1 enoyl-CoA hydratase/isomerase family protein [Komagataeibacter rhaeticus]WPP20999.1 enoyl-CoA hydratase/isomerase family protein [Komagataeibacter rhaeticus]
MEPELIEITHTGRLGRITLNRPRALNALNMDMFHAIGACLLAWRDDPGIETVLLDSASPKAFSAGGDIRAIRARLETGGVAAAATPFRTSYRMASLLAGYPKPVVSFMDGIAMGGGIGLGGHVRYRVVTERSCLAMPETAIALTPDAGGSYLLSRAPGLSGLRLALTAGRMNATAALAAGFADRQVVSSRLDSIRDALAHQPAGVVMDSLPPCPPLDAGPDTAEIAPVYSAPDMPELMGRLSSHGADWAQADLAAMQRACPFSLWVTFAAWHAARRLPDLDHALEQEFQLVCHMLARPDFAEGVRALLIDKDNAPRWTPARIRDVSEHEVACCLRARSAFSLNLPLASTDSN